MLQVCPKLCVCKNKLKKTGIVCPYGANILMGSKGNQETLLNNFNGKPPISKSAVTAFTWNMASSSD